MREFLSLKKQEPPDILYHYTDASSFLGIITQKELWISHYLYSNDIGEFEYPKLLLLERLKERREELPIGEDAIDEILDLLTIPVDDITCTFSMSVKRDNLSQWRGYANSIPGFCIGIKPKYLKQFAFQDVDNVFLSKCIYNETEQIKLIDEIIDRILVVSGLAPAVSIASHMMSRLITYSPVIKRKDFMEEEEWRLIISGVHSNSENYNFRYRNNTILPFYKIQNIDINQLIYEVIIGANAKEELNYNAVVDLCDRNKMKISSQVRNGISKSELTYRNW